MSAFPSSGIEARLFGDTIACEERRPARFLPGALAPHVTERLCLQSEALLRTLGVVEDSNGDEGTEHVHDLALQRVEAKLDLLMALVASLARNAADPPLMLRWSWRGVSLVAHEQVTPGTTGTFRVQPADWLPEALQLPATVLAAEPAEDGTRLWLEFGPLTPALAAALERHLFRVHRQAIAERRRKR